MFDCQLVPMSMTMIQYFGTQKSQQELHSACCTKTCWETDLSSEDLHSQAPVLQKLCALFIFMNLPKIKHG